MTVTVEPGNDRNTHHLKLTDGVTDVGLILCDRGGNYDPRGFRRDPIPRSSVKIYAGEQRHSDLLPPWDDRAFNDWSGGMGGEKVEDDTSRYYDANGVDTVRGGQVILGGLPIFGSGTPGAAIWENWPTWPAGYTWAPRTYAWLDLYGANRFIAVKLAATGSVARKAYLYVKKTGTVTGFGIIGVYDDSSGSPGSPNSTPIALEDSYIDLNDWPELKVYYCGVTSAVADSWLLIDGGASADASNHVSILGETISASTSYKKSADGSTWSNGTFRPYYRMCPTVGQEGLGYQRFGAHFAELKGALYAALECYDGSTSQVFINGAAGIATGGAVTYLNDTNNASIVDGAFGAAILRLFSGTGSHTPSSWAQISQSYTTGSKIAVNGTLPAAPDTTTEYAVVGSNAWTEVTGHGLSAGQYFTDMMSVNGALYLARGDGAVMKRLREFWASPTYWQWTDEGAAGTFLEKVVNPATTDVWIAGRKPPAQIWRATGLNCTGTGAVAALTFGAAINVGDMGEKITGLIVAGESFPMLHVMKEGSIHQVVSDAPNEMRISALRSAADERNGAAACVNDVYLYFSFLDSVQRYYRGQIDDIGLTKDGALPYDRKGRVAAMIPYPGRVYAIIDAGRHGTSSIVCYNGQGWHEVWRAPRRTGGGVIQQSQPRILGDLYIQPVPGDNVDRLWFAWNGDLICLPVAIDPYRTNGSDPSVAQNIQFYHFAPGGMIETAWVHFGMEEVDKLFNKVTISGTNLASTYGRVYLDYMLDSDTDYTAVGQFTVADDVGVIHLDSDYNLTGRRIRLRLRIEAANNLITPRITDMVLEGLVTVPHKYETSITFVVSDNAGTLLDDTQDDIQSADTKLAQLSTWASAAGTVAMSGHVPALDDKHVKIDAPSLQILDHDVSEIDGRKLNRYICQLRLIEVD